MFRERTHRSNQNIAFDHSRWAYCNQNRIICNQQNRFKIELNLYRSPDDDWSHSLLEDFPKVKWYFDLEPSEHHWCDCAAVSEAKTFPFALLGCPYCSWSCWDLSPMPGFGIHTGNKVKRWGLIWWRGNYEISLCHCTTLRSPSPIDRTIPSGVSTARNFFCPDHALQWRTQDVTKKK